MIWYWHFFSKSKNPSLYEQMPLLTFFFRNDKKYNSIFTVFSVGGKLTAEFVLFCSKLISRVDFEKKNNIDPGCRFRRKLLRFRPEFGVRRGWGRFSRVKRTLRRISLACTPPTRGVYNPWHFACKVRYAHIFSRLISRNAIHVVFFHLPQQSILTFFSTRDAIASQIRASRTRF